MLNIPLIKKPILIQNMDSFLSESPKKVLCKLERKRKLTKIEKKLSVTTEADTDVKL